MNFKNFEVTPLGNAVLSITPTNNLLVSNIGSSGINGVMINVASHNSYNVYFNEIPAVVDGGVLKIASLGKNAIQQTATTNELLTWYDPVTEKVNMGFNMYLMPKNYKLFGKLNGITVFEYDEENPVYDTPQPGIFWVVVAAIATCIGAGAAVYAALKPCHTKIIDREFWPNGKLRREHITIITDPLPYEIIVKGQTYLIDNWGIKYTNDFPELGDVPLVYDNSAVLISGYNLSSFEITDIV
jgi:hypothetical protein